MSDNGLFYPDMKKGKCQCEESSKPYDKRDYTVYAYFGKPWGRSADKYDNRKLLHIYCNVCGADWKDYRPKSPYWDVIGDTPYTEGEKVYCYKKKTLIGRILEVFKHGLGNKNATRNN